MSFLKRITISKTRFGIITTIMLIAFGGIFIMNFVPFIGLFLFIPALFFTYLPAIVVMFVTFDNGDFLFKFHEFGASPTSIWGWIFTFTFWFVIALLFSVSLKKKK